MIQTSEYIILKLKRSLLEYGLKHRIDYLVQKLSCDESTLFDQMNISLIRFELYNLYIIVKHKNFSKFDHLIEFLTIFNSQFPSLIDEKLFLRVLVSLKALFIYDCLKQGDLKKSCNLIKEYFPDNGIDLNLATTTNKEKSLKYSFEFKILKLRSEWNELILNKNKRELFFKTQFHIQYDEHFLNFLLKKVNLVIDSINRELPLTQIEEIMQNQYKQTNLILFESTDIQLDLEDEVRIQLFIDNLRLHKISLDSLNEKSVQFTKYLKKSFRILMDWQSEKLLNSQLQGTTHSQSVSDSMNAGSIIHEVLYLDSQFSNLQTNDDTSSSKSPPTKSIRFNKTVTEIEDITNDFTHIQTTFQTALNSFENSKDRNTIREIVSASELITDDEKEHDTSI